MSKQRVVKKNGKIRKHQHRWKKTGRVLQSPTVGLIDEQHCGICNIKRYLPRAWPCK